MYFSTGKYFCYQAKKYIGGYIAALNGIDALVFTAGVGENDYGVREKVMKKTLSLLFDNVDTGYRLFSKSLTITNSEIKNKLPIYNLDNLYANN